MCRRLGQKVFSRPGMVDQKMEEGWRGQPVPRLQEQPAEHARGCVRYQARRRHL